MWILKRIFGDPNRKIIDGMRPIVDKINALEDRYKKMSDQELSDTTNLLRVRIGAKKEGEVWNGTLLADLSKEAVQEKLDSVLPEAFAAVREASRRILGKRHYDVQLMGGIALHRGQIAELKTGEGKTLMATLALYLNALAGRGSQLITVNDYLSKVGAGWMGPIFNFLGMKTGVIVHDDSFIFDQEVKDENQYDERLSHFRRVSRKEAYACDIVYGTNNEFGFDYLRDNMADSRGRMVQGELFYTIIDEVDSILIDEARTPLIISSQAEESTDRYRKFSDLVKRLVENEDYNVDEKMRTATLTEGGVSKMENWLGVENIYVAGGVADVHHIEQALKAQVLFKRDRDYVVKEGEVIIVDEFTGRMMPGRRYSEGLHQAIEAKEGVEVQRESRTLATVTFQNYFRMYKKIAGMTGTAVTEAEEFSKIYNLDVVVVPTNLPVARKDYNDLIYRTEEAKFKAVIADVKERQEKGQPVLIGTISIEKNEILADMMEREGVKVQVLNAKNHEKEARIIAEAGRKGSVTIATNMAGRGVDIVLGGADADVSEQEEVKRLGGLHVIGTERHEARRIDNQLRGRAGRQGDPGSSQFFVSTEDDLMRIFGGDRIKKIMQTLNVPDDMPIENKFISKSIESAQKRVEGHNFDIRKHLVEYDDVINKHREAVYKRRRETLKAFEDSSDESSLSRIILGMVDSEIEQVVSFHTGSEIIKEWNIKEIYEVVNTIFPVEPSFRDDLLGLASGNKLDRAKARTALIEKIFSAATSRYNELRAVVNGLGLDWKILEKDILLRSIDTLWIEHLEAMGLMRQGIGLRGYGQRDPLVEYKKEAYRMFNEFNSLVQRQVVYSVFKLGNIRMTDLIGAESNQNNIVLGGNNNIDKAVILNKNSDSNNENIIAVDNEKKVGRNDPCICGSGKKYKKCCGA